MSSSVTLFIESNNTRREVSSDPKYSPICTLIANALQHLISSPALVILYTTIWSIFLKSDAAAAAFKEKFGEGVPTQDQLVAYLRNQPPAVIIADGTNDVGEFSWGSVLKGSSELAQNNELFLSQELVTALLDKTDPISASVSETDYKRLAFRLIFIVTYFHEVQHCASKYFFSPFLLTPSTATLGSDDGDGIGESGRAFERAYLGYIPLVEWEREEDLKKTHRFWRLSRVLASTDGQNFFLDSMTLARLLDSFNGSDLHRILFSSVTPAPDKSNAVLWRTPGKEAQKQHQHSAPLSVHVWKDRKWVS